MFRPLGTITSPKWPVTYGEHSYCEHCLHGDSRLARFQEIYWIPNRFDCPQAIQILPILRSELRSYRVAKSMRSVEIGNCLRRTV
ncbi:hypothetical protein GALMADRAFT_1066717 [Galerina marginata CBS 339.88]|uniref:Uncharacterized protein n=1 Tax=Galerina marginata (strain CBS 339.88) TaxID=685588 RepID=A0A067SD15_GALM3|nr:hypothetical protein GALMADRAFT_1066717 [Galerina marginata CBS 339.88]